MGKNIENTVDSKIKKPNFLTFFKATEYFSYIFWLIKQSKTKTIQSGFISQLYPTYCVALQTGYLFIFMGIKFYRNSGF